MVAILTDKQIDNVDTLAIELSDYEGTLRLLKLILKPKGVFVQWDWLKIDENSNSGFTEDIIQSAFIHAGLNTVTIKQAFSLESKRGSMPVLMGIARNA